jgi:hypothetical protein
MKPLATVAIARVSFAGGVALTIYALPRWAALQATQPQTTVDQPVIKPLTCWLNQRKQTCLITPVGSGGAFKISFSAGDQPFFVFTPEGPPTTNNRPMRDAQGRQWLFSGNRSFTLTEQGGFKNVISVASN